MSHSPGKMSDLRSVTGDTFSTKYKLSEFQEEKIRSYQQLENFYMPYLKRAHQEALRQNMQMRPPEELLVNSKLLEMKEADMKRKIQTLQKDNETKETRMRELASRMSHLVSRLRTYEPGTVDTDLASVEDNEKKIQRLESLLRIKNEEAFFRLKIKGTNLLHQFGLSQEEAIGIKDMKDESEMFDFILSKLKLCIKDYRSKEKETNQESYKEKAEQIRLNDRIQFLSESNELLKNNEGRMKDKLEEIKREWTLTCDRLIIRERELEQKQNEIFKFRRLLDEKDNAIMMLTSKHSEENNNAEKERMDLETQLRDMRTLLSMYNNQKSELQAVIDDKQSQLEENRIKDKFNQEEYEKVLREATRWKERYQWLENEKDGKVKLFEKENLRLDGQLKKSKLQLESVKLKLHEFTVEKEQLRSINQRANDELNRKEAQIKELTTKVSGLEHSIKSKVAEVEESYMRKFSNSQMQRDSQIREAIRSKEEEFRLRSQASETEWNMRIQELQKSYESKLVLEKSSHNRILEELSKAQEDYRFLLELNRQRDKSAAKTYISSSRQSHVVMPTRTQLVAPVTPASTSGNIGNFRMASELTPINRLSGQLSPTNRILSAQSGLSTQRIQFSQLHQQQSQQLQQSTQNPSSSSPSDQATERK